MIRRSKALRLLAVLGTFALAAFAVACGDDDDGGGGGAASDGELQKVQYMLPYQDSISFMGLLIAKDQCFADEGLEVETLPSEGSDYVVQQLIAGNVKYGPAGRQHFQVVTCRQQLPHERGGIENVLKVIQYQEEVFVLQMRLQAVQ